MGTDKIRLSYQESSYLVWCDVAQTSHPPTPCRGSSSLEDRLLTSVHLSSCWQGSAQSAHALPRVLVARRSLAHQHPHEQLLSRVQSRAPLVRQVQKRTASGARRAAFAHGIHVSLSSVGHHLAGDHAGSTAATDPHPPDADTPAPSLELAGSAGGSSSGVLFGAENARITWMKTIKLTVMYWTPPDVQ